MLVITAALFGVGRHLIGLYIGHGAVGSGFGAAGSLVAVLVWVYYSAQIFLFGAEFTWVVAHRVGSRRGLAPAMSDTPPPASTAPAPGKAKSGTGAKVARSTRSGRTFRRLKARATP